MRSLKERQHARKGQAAMEFLMTYGWAILAAIIAIGVLAYFGVFNPSRLAGSAAVVNAPFNVDAFSILNDGFDDDGAGGDDCIRLEVTHNAGQSITLEGANITLTSGATGTNLNCGVPNNPISGWSSGTSRLLNITCYADLFSSGDSIAGNVELRYTTSSSSLEQVSTGNVRGVAQ